jgi:hypothetical protein
MTDINLSPPNVLKENGGSMEQLRGKRGLLAARAALRLPHKTLGMASTP